MDEGDVDCYIRTIVAAETCKTSSIFDTDDKYASARRLVLGGVRRHTQAGFVSGPCADGIPVALYKCLLLCLKRLDAEQFQRSHDFERFLACMMKKFLVQVQHASLVTKEVERAVAAAESSWTQHAQVLSFDGMAKPADMTIFLEIVGNPPGHAVLCCALASCNGLCFLLLYVLTMHTVPALQRWDLVTA